MRLWPLAFLLLLACAAGPAEVRHEKDGSVLVAVPGGRFPMGFGSARREVEVPAFLIGRTEVTNEQYGRFAEATGRPAPKGPPDHPVTDVSWHDAAAYCQWAGLRLPTQAEWEKAAAGPDGRLYPWGDDWRPDLCNSSESGRGMTTPVGFFPLGASPCGALDMAGNVSEWCSDAVDGQARAIRGGNWNSPIGYCLAATPDLARPDEHADFLGFRVAKDAP